MSFPGFTTLSPGMEKRVSSTKTNRLGAEGYMFPGRWFKYALAGEAVTVALIQTTVTAIDGHDLDLAVNTAAAGDTTLNVTPASTAVIANEYADGFIIVNNEGEEGHQYLVKEHPAAGVGVEVVITLDEPDGLVTAFVAATVVGLTHSDCFDFVVNPTSFTDAPLGVACVDWSDNDFGWLQFRGNGIGVADATAPAGALPIASSNGTAGAFEVDLEDGTAELPHIGTQRDGASVDTEAHSVKWLIA
jgi:hypothetical protein